MDLAAASAGPWLVLGVILGVLLAGVVALGITWTRRSVTRSPDGAPEPERATVGGGWVVDDLPGFLEQPPGLAAEVAAERSTAAHAPLLTAQRTAPVACTEEPRTGRLLVVLATAAVVLVGVASAIAAAGPRDRTTAAPAEPAPPTWRAPDLAAVPAQPEPGDPGAGRLAASSVPIGDAGALVRLTFEGLVLERHAVGVTVAYPGVSVTAAEVPGGPALAHVRLPLWNCLADAAPADPVADGCRRLPTEYSDLPSPALAVTDDGAGLRITGRFATYVRPGGSAPEWTGRVYPLTVRVRPDGEGATGSIHLGTDRAEARADPRLTELRRGR